ncbi:hypothetical protein [Actinomadura sp. DC4]|uniref:hypothetical protein n=1 Tax=Actinomadura sp. DC4 TaxID=3055069 RepID=UPI0025B14752|nr:hypothetical protein [Actinomadura sp. DC4]MDN3359736.1 hypothetical protein [Actinomadura sp. DC4]
MRKKLSAAAGLVTIAAAGALITSTPALAASEDITMVTAVAGPASATVGDQASVSSSTRTVANDRRRRHRHRRHHRHHRRHHRHHRHHHRY